MEFYLHIPFPDPVGDARNGVLPTAVLWRSMDYIHHLPFVYPPTLVRILQRNRANKKRFMTRNWLMPLWRLASPKYAEWVSRLEIQEEPVLQFKSRVHLLQNSFLLREEWALCFIQATQNMEVNGFTHVYQFNSLSHLVLP